MPFLSSSGISILNIIRGGAAGGAAPLLLDLYPATAAYSLRKLSTAYSGSAIRVRIDTTGQPEYDIGFDSNGNLDTADLLSKAGANDGFVTTWYDQQGSNNATQAAAANQPKIVSSGTVITESSLPVLQFNGAQQLVFIASSLSTVSIFSVLKSGNSASEMTAFNFGDSTNAAALHFNRSATNSVAYAVYNGTAASSEGGAVSSQFLASAFSVSNSSADLYINNANVSNAYQGRTSPGGNAIGSRVSSFYLTGNISELVYYNSNQISNISGINTNINSYYSIYP